MADILKTVSFGARRSSAELCSRAYESRVDGSGEPSGAAGHGGAEPQSEKQRWMAPVHAPPVFFRQFGQRTAEPPNWVGSAEELESSLVGAPASTFAQRRTFGWILAAAAEHEAADRQPAVFGAIEPTVFGSAELESALFSSAQQSAVFRAAGSALLSPIGWRLSRCAVGRRVSWCA